MFNSDCPHSIPNSLWKHGLDCCPVVPKISPLDILIYLVETKSYQNHLEALGAYKGMSCASKQAEQDGWVKDFSKNDSFSLINTLIPASISE